jgi:hypothetical protein
VQPTIADFFTTITFCPGGPPKSSLYFSFVLPLFQQRTRSAFGRGIDEARLSCLHLEVGTCSWCLGCSRRVAE